MQFWPDASQSLQRRSSLDKSRVCCTQLFQKAPSVALRSRVSAWGTKD